jgi:SAM-dependent methyltransferase
MGGSPFPLLGMLVREWLSGPQLARRPEPSAAMDDPRSVEAFHAQGAETGPLLPVYHFNALSLSALTPPGRTLLDLGCGSGRFLAYLARYRPDLRIVGLDLAPAMVERGRRYMREAGVADRVDLRMGDMTAFTEDLPAGLATVSSVFSLHHLPTEGALCACLAGVARACGEHGAAFWAFDHARPRHPRTASVFPEVFTPGADPAFQADSTNSLRASFSFEEISRALEAAGLGEARHRCARLMRLYQIHWVPGRGPGLPSAGACGAPALPGWAAKQVAGLEWLFPVRPATDQGA